MRWTRSLLTLSLAASSVAAQSGTTASLIPTVQRWISLPAAPGRERFATDRIQAADKTWTRDALGDLVKTRGTGSPVRVVACGLDAPAYAISQITDSGYLRVHLNGNGARHPLWDQFHEGQRILIMTGDRARPSVVRFVPGVFAVRSTHLWRHRVNTLEAAPASIEDLWIDVGARSKAEVARIGIQLLDPVFRDLPPWSVDSYVTGPEAAARAGCAAVAAASQGTPVTGTSIFVLSVHSNFNWSGLTGVLARLKNVDSVTVVRASSIVNADLSSAVRADTVQLPHLPGVHMGVVRALAVRSRFPRALVESIRDADLNALFGAVATAAGVSRVTPVLPDASLPMIAEHRDSLSQEADLLARLTDRYAVTRHEAPSRDVVRDALPAWAKARATVDSIGNLIVAAGPDRDTIVFVAHTDEIGFEITRLRPDGYVELRPRGSFSPTLYIGQPALLHRDSDKQPATGVRDCVATSASAQRGVFVTADTGSTRNPFPNVLAWFGDNPAAMGIAPGMTLTGYKCATRMGEQRFSARSIDDRAGDVALLYAVAAINPSTLDHKVIFAWSVQEEGGLIGAADLAAHLGVSVRRVHAVDTFVSGDSPLESPRFAGSPLGEGPVVRAHDNSSVTPPEELERALRIARAAKIPLQYGATNGGNDGSEFTRFGVVDVPVGWPLRYSHSPAEVADLRDIRSLGRMVAALAVAPVR